MNTTNQFITQTDSIRNFLFSEGAYFKRAITDWRDQNIANKQASERISIGFEHCLRAISGLDRTITYLDDDFIVLFGSDIPEKLQQDLSLLSGIANQNLHLYSGYQSSIKIICERYNAIQTIIKRLLSTNMRQSHTTSGKLNLKKQLGELKRDFIILAETELLLLERLMPLFHGSAIRQMKNRLQQAA